MIPVGIIMHSRITQAKSIQRRTYMGSTWQKVYERWLAYKT